MASELLSVFLDVVAPVFAIVAIGTLLGPRDGFKGVRGGVADWATCYVQNEGRATPLALVFE